MAIAVASRPERAYRATAHALLLSSVSIAAGILWDISWHRTIGRDTFWSPPHLLEQIGAMVAGFTCGALVLRATFAKPADWRTAGVRFWGFSGPLGAWVAIWGTLLTITSAPFDNWWHNAYGLDVKIMSPPHMVLAVGLISIQVGAMLMVLAAQNRASDPDRVRTQGWIYALAGAVILAMLVTLVSEHTSRPNQMHAPRFYQVTAVVFPIFLAAFARSGRLRYPATSSAAIYMAFLLAAIWILQLFPARPQLAPIFNPVTRMVPPEFPLLLVVPAVAFDLLIPKESGKRDWVLAAKLGVVFVGLFLASHWYFAEFLLSPAARNHVFAGDQWPYMTELGPWRYEYWGVPTRPDGSFDVLGFARGMGIATVIAMISARLGLWLGAGMARVMR